MYVANVNETGFTNNPHLDAVTARAKGEGAVVVAVCAAIEAEIAQLEDADRAEFLKDLGLSRTGPEPRDPRRLPAAGPADLFHRRREGSARLDGPRAARPRRRRPVSSTRISSAASSAPKSSATTTSSPARARPGAKEAGKLRLEGKEYIVREGDVMHFRFNV